MKRRIERSERALRDLLEAYTHIGQGSREAALRFLEAADQTFVMLAENPGVGRVFASKHGALRAIRVWPVTTFRNYLVFYTVEPERIAIARVVHGARDLPALIDA